MQKATTRAYVGLSVNSVVCYLLFMANQSIASSKTIFQVKWFVAVLLETTF